MSFGVATMTVVAVAMVGSLTVLPALLSKLGDKVEKGRIPFLRRRERPDGESRFWSKVLNPAMKHPLVALIAAGGVLLALTVPVLQLHTVQNGIDTVSKSMPTVDTLQRWQKAFPGDMGPAEVAIKGDVNSTAAMNAIDQLRAAALKSPLVHAPVDIVYNNTHTVVRIDVPLAGNGVDSTSIQGLKTLRNDIVPATLGKVPGIEYAVGGGPAESYDYNTTMKHAAPIVFGFVLAFAFLLLLVSFRSVVIAVKAILLNLLSVGAAYGVMILAFQKGWASGLLGFTANGGIANWLPIFMFVILFGLSMDYHVFILSRVREAYDRGMKTEDAVEHGIKSTAGVVSSAALVMVGVFAIFATLPILDMKEMGIGLAAAVLIDATIVRAVLLPATMKLLGDWNWYLPKWLEWLPRLEHEPQAEPPPAEAAPVAA
jgi:RND superfamily putative drug exporter